MKVSSKKRAYFINIGMIPYEKAWKLQQALVELRQQDKIPDILLFCEHPHVITVGRRQTGHQNILSDRFPIYQVERGGDATYHGPGQLVGYPILFLEEQEKDPHKFLRSLEQALCGFCQSLGVVATTKEQYTGVWTQDQERKLASLGVAMRNGVTFHGFALNVTTDLSCFLALNPCGLSANVMTSLEKEGVLTQGSNLASYHPQLALYLSKALNRDFSFIHPSVAKHSMEFDFPDPQV